MTGDAVFDMLCRQRDEALAKVDDLEVEVEKAKGAARAIAKDVLLQADRAERAESALIAVERDWSKFGRLSPPTEIKVQDIVREAVR